MNAPDKLFFLTPVHNNPITYRPDIDGLRAVAILLVVIYHAFPVELQGGFIGVDIFFVISGFLISNIIFDSLQQGNFSFVDFYRRRINRIFPALVLVLISVYAVGWFVLLPNELEQLGKHIAAGTGFIQNIVLWKEAGYFDTASEFKPLMHLWSLAIEEQFYLIYPLFVFCVWRLKLDLLRSLVLLAIVSFGLNIFGVSDDPVKNFFLAHTRMWELLAGSALSYITRFKNDANSDDLHQQFFPSQSSFFHIRLELFNNLFSVVGLFLILTSALWITKDDLFPGALALAPVGGALLLILSGPKTWINRRILASRFMVFVGLISYPLYLWHWPILSFIRIVEAIVPSVEIRLAALVLSVVLAYLTYRLVEVPIRIHARAWKKTASLCILLLIVGTMGFHAFKGEGFAFRLKEQNELIEQLKWAETDKASEECRRLVGSNDMGYCLTSMQKKPDVALIGDSHANSLFSGLAAEYEKVGKALINLGGPGCVPFYDTDSYVPGEEYRPNSCRNWINQALDFAAASPSVHTIILSSYAIRQMQGDAMGRPDAKPLFLRYYKSVDLPKSEVFGTAFRETLRSLAATGKEIIVVADWPELGFEPRTCFDVRPFRIQSTVTRICSVEREVVMKRNHLYRTLLGQLQNEFPNVKLFDPFPHLCDEEQCHAIRNGHLVYRDNNHLSKFGSKYVGGAFALTFIQPNER